MRVFYGLAFLIILSFATSACKTDKEKYAGAGKIRAHQLNLQDAR